MQQRCPGSLIHSEQLAAELLHRLLNAETLIVQDCMQPQPAEAQSKANLLGEQSDRQSKQAHTCSADDCVEAAMPS